MYMCINMKFDAIGTSRLHSGWLRPHFVMWAPRSQALPVLSLAFHLVRSPSSHHLAHLSILHTSVSLVDLVAPAKWRV